MKILTTLLLMFTASLTVAQDLRIPDNPFDKADQSVSSRKAFQRQKWFYEQRMYPNNYIPRGAYEKAMDEKNLMKAVLGFSMAGPFDTWSSLGPTTGFYFGYSNITSRMASVKYDPSNPNTIYAAGACGGIWKSTNGGATWSSRSDYEVSLSSGSIAIDPANTQIIYYGTGEATYSIVSYYGRGILKSTNGGLTWTNYTSGLPSASFAARIMLRPNHSTELLAAMSYDGLYRSTNSGVSWTRIASGRCDDVIFTPGGDTAYAIGSGTGYLISTNGGASFSSSGGITPGERNHLAVCKSTPSVLYASVYNPGNISAFKSTNSGSSFFQISPGHNFDPVQGWYDFYMHVNPFDANVAYLGSIDIWRTTNGGSSFTNITFGYGGGNVHVDQHNLDFHPTDPNQMLCVNDGGIWKSTNKGTNWTNLNNTSLTLTQFYRIAADPSNASHILGGTQDNGTQRTTGSLSWTAAYGGDGGEVCFHSRNNLYILGETQVNGVFRSTDGGLTFADAQSGLSGSGAWIGPIISHPDSNGIFYTARQQVFKTTNWGASWFAISSGTSGTITQLAISKSSAAVMYASCDVQIYKSTDRGYTFTGVTNGLPNAYITSINVHPDSSQTAVITFSGFGHGKIFKTSNGGTTWTSITANLPDSPANDAVIYHPGTATSVYYTAMDVGVFVTNNFGQSWLELANGLPNTVVLHLDHHKATNKLRAGTHGRGVFEISLGTTLIDVQSVSVGLTGERLFPTTTIVPSGSVKNNGPSSATFTCTRKISPGGYANTQTVSALAPGASYEVTYAPWTFNSGTVYTITDSVYIAGDINILNNVLKGVLTPAAGEYLTLLAQGFYSATFPPSGWTLINAGTGYITRNNVSSYGIGTGSVKYDNWNYGEGTTQSIVTPSFTATVAGDSIVLDHAYSPYNNSIYTDSLIIEASSNGGTTYSAAHRLWGSIDGGPLNTAGTNLDDFVPAPNQWGTLTLPLPAGTNRIRFRGVSDYGNNLYIDSIRVISPRKHTQFNITVFPQGLYNNVTAKLNRRDTVRAYLRNSVSPFARIDSAAAVADSVSLTAAFVFRNANSGTYYIHIKHRNSVETWSKAGGVAFTRGVFGSYDFSTSAGQAYGNNLVLKGAKYCIYSGDVNQDGTVDIADLGLIDNDVFNFATGYRVTDLTGDDNTDLSDLLIADNNAFNFIGRIIP